MAEDGFLKLQGIFVADVFVYLFVFPNWGWQNGSVAKSTHTVLKCDLHLSGGPAVWM